MKISNVKLKYLSDRVLKGTATNKELAELNEWYASFDDEDVTVFTNESKDNVRTTLLNKIERRIQPDKTIDKLWPKRVWKYAAVIALLLVSSATLYHSYQSNINTPTSKAFSSIVKSTEMGQKKTIHLPDGSKVKLNAGSSIEFPESFDDDKRMVKLTGEAYFDVVRDVTNPFIIHTNNVKVEVLGTSFNVRSYSDETKTEVVVETGSVKVNNKKCNQTLVLSPYEMAIALNDTLTMYKRGDVDVEAVFGWVDGKLIFHDETLPIILTRLSRWYGVEFDISHVSDNSNLKITANFVDASISEVLETLSHNYNFNYEINGKKITIK